MTMWRMSSLAFILISLLLSVVPVLVTVRSQTTSTPPLQVTVFTPKPGDVVGINGLGESLHIHTHSHIHYISAAATYSVE